MAKVFIIAKTQITLMVMSTLPYKNVLKDTRLKAKAWFAMVGFAKIAIANLSLFYIADIDECAIELSCPRPKVCVNTIGSFTCEGEDTPQCPPGFHFKPATGTCEGKFLRHKFNLCLAKHRI